MSDQTIQKQIDDLNARITKLANDPPLPDHFHTGFDVSKINFSDLYQKKVWVYHTVVGTMAATAANYGVFFIVPFTCILKKFQEVHKVAGSDAGAVSLTLEKLASAVAPDSGTAMLASVLSLKATADTVQTGTLSTTSSSLNLAVGDRLCLKDAGTLTAVANVTVSVELQLT